MIVTLITATILGIAGLLLEGVGEALIGGLFGCLGAIAVRFVTFGRIRLDPWSDSVPGTAQVVGLVIVLLASAVCLSV